MSVGLLGPLNCGTGDVIMLGGGPPAYSGAGTALSDLALPALTASCLAALVTSAGATPVGVSLSSVCALPAPAQHACAPQNICLACCSLDHAGNLHRRTSPTSMQRRLTI